MSSEVGSDGQQQIRLRVVIDPTQAGGRFTAAPDRLARCEAIEDAQGFLGRRDSGDQGLATVDAARERDALGVIARGFVGMGSVCALLQPDDLATHELVLPRPPDDCHP